MKKFGVMATALVLCVALGVTSLAVAQTKKVKSTITLKFTNGVQYTEDTFSGQVKAKKGCQKKRKVVINGTNLSTKTDGTGHYLISAGNVDPGTYTAKVLRKKRKKPNGTKIVCKPATSNAVVVP